MSKRRVLGKSDGSPAIPRPSTLLPQNGQAKPQNEDFICPMCNLPMKSLAQLNHHVDSLHLNIPSQDTPLDRKISKNHDKRATSSSLPGSTVSTTRSGQPQHKRVDNGIWSKCCLQCLNDFDGWNGVIGNAPLVDKTDDFNRMRKTKREEESLRNLVLERRVQKVFNWIVETFNSSGRFSESELRAFENQLTDWQDGHSVSECPICHTDFGFFIRKHHCRICGDIVCGDLRKGCSMVIPLGIIFDLIKPDENTTSKNQNGEYEKIEHFLKKDMFGVRVCSNCKRRVFNKRVFEIDKLKCENGEFMRSYKMWKMISNKIQTENMTEIKNDEENAMLVSLFTRLDKLAKQIQNIKSESQLSIDELKLYNTLEYAIVNYVQAKLPILRKAQEEKLAREREVLQELINGKPKLSMRDLREKREKLMVLNEQKFVVESMYQDFKKQRRFDDLKALDSNLEDIEREIQQLTEELGDEAFH
ncbi:hypothetical protein PMKS-000479 [Pichia membranifaciens]|uniref:FYVE-type domain-containing protein n=1 Tax=Pichia membranifaciens TaxID=4926 RepID=A0A1Q2YBZ1_9ASCO|nr:hypothetical protein PMKS-000479 [Pichia membranifaciens]